MLMGSLAGSASFEVRKAFQFELRGAASIVQSADQCLQSSHRLGVELGFGNCLRHSNYAMKFVAVMYLNQN